MPAPLVSRLGPETPRSLELAARRRHAEATLLERREPLGAVYLHGYSIEMRLKVAYYRLAGIGEGSPIGPTGVSRHRSPRLVAEDRIQGLRASMMLSRRSPGHDLEGWALLVEEQRASLGHSVALCPEMLARARRIAVLWSESLRYHSNKPGAGELGEVRDTARWFQRNCRRLGK